MSRSQLPAGRRLSFAVVVLISQLLLIGLSLAWLVHMIIIAANGSVYFVERNPAVLWLEVSLTALTCVFGVAVFVMQLHRMGERRSSDRGAQHQAANSKSQSDPHGKGLAE